MTKPELIKVKARPSQVWPGLQGVLPKSASVANKCIFRAVRSVKELVPR
jgi:hypothetical protein